MLNPKFFRKFAPFITGAFILYTILLIVPILLSFAYSFLYRLFALLPPCIFDN